MFETILVPVDLAHKERLLPMVETATAISGDNRKEIVLLTVLPDLPGYVAAQVPEQVTHDAELSAKTEMAELVASAGLTAENKTLIRHGNPADVILETARELGVDVIVIGSHRPGFQDYFLGSVAGRVVRHAKCSVLVQRGGE